MLRCNNPRRQSLEIEIEHSTLVILKIDVNLIRIYSIHSPHGCNEHDLRLLIQMDVYFVFQYKWTPSRWRTLKFEHFIDKGRVTEQKTIDGHLLIVFHQTWWICHHYSNKLAVLCTQELVLIMYIKHDIQLQQVVKVPERQNVNTGARRTDLYVSFFLSFYFIKESYTIRTHLGWSVQTKRYWSK